MSDSNEDFDEQAIAALGDSASDHASHDESCSSIFDMPDSDSDDSGAYDIPSSASSHHDGDQPPQKRKRFTEVFNDKCVLRNRDLVLSKPSSEASKRPRKKEAPDMRSWQLSGILRRAFSTDGRLHGVQRSAHSSDRLASVVVSMACQQLEEDAVREQVLAKVSKCPSSSPWPCCIMLRKCDEQSQKVMVDKAFSLALAKWMQQKYSNWGVFTQGEISTLMKHFEFTRVHIVDIMSQRCWLKWGPGPKENHEFLCRPSVMQSKKATCVRKSLDAAVKGLSFDDIFKLSVHVMLFIIITCSDSATSMLKAFAGIMASSPRNVVMLRTPCDLHQISRVQQTSLASQGHISFFYSVGQLLKQESYHMRFVMSFFRVVCKSFDWSPGAPVDPSHNTFKRIVLQYTIARQTELRSARGPMAPQPARQPRAHARSCTMCQNLASSLDADWLQKFASHKCSQCQPRCRSKVEAVKKVFKPFVDYFSLRQRDSNLNRWLAPQEMLSFWAFISNCCGLGIEAWLTEFPVFALPENINDLVDDEIERQRKEQTKRLRASSLHLSTTGIHRDLLIHAIVTTPFDGFVQELMRHSSNENMDALCKPEPIIWSMLDQSNGPVIATQIKLCTLLEKGSDLDLTLREYIRQEEASSLGLAPDTIKARLDELWAQMCHTSVAFILYDMASLYSRLEIRYANAPMSVFNIVNPRLAHSAQVHVVEHLLASCPCCLDYAFSQKLLQNFAHDKDTWLKGPVRGYLLQAAPYIHVETRDIEDTHAQRRTVGKTGRGTRSAAGLAKMTSSMVLQTSRTKNMYVWVAAP